MSVLEYGKLIIAFISASKGIQISFTLISLIGCLCGYISGFLIFWTFKILDKYKGE